MFVLELCELQLVLPFLRFFFFSSRRRHTRFSRDWSSDVCSSDLWRRITTRRWWPSARWCAPVRTTTPRSWPVWPRRSEEHTSELQSRENLVCRLLLEKKKKKKINKQKKIKIVYIFTHETSSMHEE